LPVFKPELHEPGDRMLLGRTVPAGENGAGQADFALEMLAAHPRTIDRLARKLAAALIDDTPPEATVRAMTTAWTASGGQLSRVYAALLASPDAWRPEARKYKTPDDFVTSAARAVGMAPEAAGQPDLLIKALRGLGQLPFGAPAPTGYPDRADAWLTPDGVMERLNVAMVLARLAPADTDARTLMTGIVPVAASSATPALIGEAASTAEAVALVLASPEFQRR
jgi:uncharacterized protein (DUF1800 family)